MINISEIVENVSKVFGYYHFDVVEYDSYKIICNKDDFDFRIFDYIKNEFDCNVEYEFKLDDYGFEIVEIQINNDEFDKKVDKLTNELMIGLECEMSTKKELVNDFQLEYHVKNEIAKRLLYSIGVN